jgi:cell division protein FtsL
VFDFLFSNPLLGTIAIIIVAVIVVLSRFSERILFGPVERVIARRWGTATP